MGEMINSAALDGSGDFTVYRATPTGPSKGAIIVIQEIFGVNPGIRAKVDGWAKLGYTGYALDLFWRLEPGLVLDPDIPEQFETALGYYGRFDRDKGIADIEAVIRTARHETGGKVGVTGFCLGGLLSYLAATRTDADASVGYYGGGIDNFLGESHAIGRPLLLHFAEKDHFIPPAAVDKVRTALDNNPHVEIHVYAGVDHGFATEFGKRRDETAAQAADARTRAFFAAHIG